MRKKKKRMKKPVDPDAPYRTLYWYEKDNFVPPNSLVAFTDVERWKNAAHERYPSFDLVVKFKHELDRDRSMLSDTTEMAFWLAWKKRPLPPEDVEYKVFEECLEQCLDECYGYSFNKYIDPREYSPDDESLSWHSLLDFVDPEKDPNDSSRDKPKADEDEWLRTNPIIEMFEECKAREGCHGVGRKKLSS